MNGRLATGSTVFRVLILAVAGIFPAASALIDLKLLPGSSLAAGPGQTAGWGYTLANNSPDQWLVPTALNSDPFLFGTPMLLFDFPVLAPVSSVSVGFDGVELTGLYQVSLASDAPIGFVEQGLFRLSAQWWSGDPLAGGQLLSQAEDILLPWRLTIVQVPEPAYGLPLCVILPAMYRLRRKRS